MVRGVYKQFVVLCSYKSCILKVMFIITGWFCGLDCSNDGHLNSSCDIARVL